jgi:hypothetical protein
VDGFNLARVRRRAREIVESGFMNTDFGGRSLDFSNDVALTESQPLIHRYC